MRRICGYRHYFRDFYESLSEKEQKKIDYALMLLKSENRVSKKFVKHLEDEIYELRTGYSGMSYRILFIFDEGNVIVLFNCFSKKTMKTPRREIELAIKLKNEYYESKTC